MESKLLLMLLAGLWVPPGYFQESYGVIKKRLTWTAALDYCRTNHKGLAMAADALEVEELMERSMTYPDSLLWIGLRHQSMEWKWSLQMEGYYDDGGAEFRKWNSPEPNDITQAKENCALMGGDGLWYDTSCSAQRTFTCFTGSSPSSWSLVFMNEKLSWSEARSYCRQNNGDLPSIRNQQENDQVLQATSYNENWIGLYRDPWRWLDGTPSTVTRWNSAANQPDGGELTPCVASHQNFWDDRPCSEQNWFICRTDPLKRRVLKLTVTTDDWSERLDDWAEAILEQLTESLTAFGTEGNVTLVWIPSGGKVFHRQEVTAEASERLCSPVT